MIEEIIPLINNVGFPIAVAVIFIYDKLKSNAQLRKAVENNTAAIADLRTLIYERRLKK